MSRQNKYPETDTFTFRNENPKNRITEDCVFRAIATATQKSWAEVVQEMAEVSLRTGYAINGKQNINAYLTGLGWTKHKQPRKPDGTKYTGAEFCRALQRREGGHGAVGDTTRIVANIGGLHTVAIVDGKVNDTWDSTGGCIGNYWTR